ncbi:MAG: rhomboid family intramembrane serine protease [Planctomycetaceae bacterium]|jgi:membrane associated rhomboid family serine protease|nr:rhomboid family intramembrane serine protease [Planctomycetaceae bacterium]
MAGAETVIINQTNMAFSDRDYNRYDPYEDRPNRRKSGQGMSVTMKLVIINVGLWVANGTLCEGNWLTNLLCLKASSIQDPLCWWQFLTYGFVHAPDTLWHIGGNLISLIMFGYGIMLGIGSGGFGLVRSDNVEDYLGRTEYLFFYLITIFLGGVVFSFTNGASPKAAALGASGGITGVVILYAWLFPNKKLYLYGILPLPMWMLGVLIVVMDTNGASGTNDEGIAYTIHLTGAAFATLYYFIFLRRGVRLTDNYYLSLLSTRRKNVKPKPFKPTLRIFGDEPEDETDDEGAEFSQRLDEILSRYGKVGESGLTAEEREFLQHASKMYREKNKLVR